VGAGGELVCQFSIAEVASSPTPRQARLDLPGLLQHVIARGIERGKIFFDDEDREAFVGRLSRLLVATKTQCHAWALLPNHFHLLLRPTEGSLSSFMRRLQTGYAVTFNLRHKRSGHLFQNRYKSIVCGEEEYLASPGTSTSTRCARGL